MKSRIQFAVPGNSIEAKDKQQSVATPNRVTPDSISDICKAVFQPEANRAHLGILVDENLPKQRHRMTLPQKLKSYSHMRMQSLENLLKSGQRITNTLVLTRRDRLYTAVTLASNVLQLEATMWFHRLWTSDDIIFHYEEGSTSLRSNPLRNQP